MTPPAPTIRSGRQVPPMESPRLVLQVEAEAPLDPPKARGHGPRARGSSMAGEVVSWVCLRTDLW